MPKTRFPMLASWPAAAIMRGSDFRGMRLCEHAPAAVDARLEDTMSDTPKQLQRAYRLINKQQTAEALSLLRPLTIQEPENPDVWWLMAYALEEPTEVREALITVLRLNPNYSNAAKARELLQALNEQHPPSQEEIARFPDFLQQYSAFPDAFASEPAEMFSSSADDTLFEETDAFFERDPFGDVFAEPDTAGQDSYTPDAFYVPDDAFDENVFSVIEEEPEAALAEEKPAKKSRKERQAERRAEQERKKAEKAAEAKLDDVARMARDLGVEPDQLDDELLARLEEKAARHPRRGARIMQAVLALFLIAIVAVGVGALLTRDRTVRDPGELKLVDAASLPEVNLTAINDAIQSVNLGSNSRAVIAESDLGTTLFVEYCSQPGTNIPSAIMRGIDAIASQAPSVQGQVKAVGVSVNACDGEKRDTLYRAVVKLESAINYSAGLRTPKELASFQSRWKSS